MELPLLLLMLVALCLASVPVHMAESQAESYWKAKFGNTPMPQVVVNSLKGVKDEIPNAKLITNELLEYGDTDGKSSTTASSKLHSTNEKLQYEGTDGNNVVTASSKLHSTNEELKYAGDENRVHGKNAAIADAKVLEYRGLDLFFLEKKLIQIGGKVRLQFTSNNVTKFLPLQVAKSIPFSYSKLPEILNLMSIKPTSKSVKVIKKTLKVCESKPVKGEKKYCTTSLETLVDHVISNVGSKAKLFSTTIENDNTMVYTLEKAQKISNYNLVCHGLNYPYAVFYCHNIKNTISYVVTLVDANGKKNKVAAVCHKETSTWSPRHLSFRLLKVRPGVPICHFLNADSIVWVPGSSNIEV